MLFLTIPQCYTQWMLHFVDAFLCVPCIIFVFCSTFFSSIRSSSSSSVRPGCTVRTRRAGGASVFLPSPHKSNKKNTHACQPLKQGWGRSCTQIPSEIYTSICTVRLALYVVPSYAHKHATMMMVMFSHIINSIFP